MGTRASLAAQTLKNLSPVQETWVQPLGWEDPLEKGMATYSSILAWRIPWTEEFGRLQTMGSQKVGYDWVSNTSLQSYLETVALNLQPLPPFNYTVTPNSHTAQVSLRQTLSFSIACMIGSRSNTSPLQIPQALKERKHKKRSEHALSFFQVQ